jgi:hypothetical protein
MVKNAISDYSSTAASNTDVGGVNIDEGMSPSGVNNAIRELMSHLADLNAGTSSLGTIKVDNLQLDGNAITSTDTNGNISLTPNGTGSVVLDGINYPQADGTANHFLKTDGLGQLSFAQVDTASIAADAIDGTKIADDSIDSEHYVDGSIDTAHIADDAVTSAKILDNNVGAAELNVSGNGTSGQMLTSDGDGSMSWADAPSGGGGLTGQFTKITATGNFTVPADTTSLVVELVGGGGGGGGISNYNYCASGGGAGGGYARKYISGLTPGDTISVTIGAGGAGGASTISAYGSTGGTTSFGAYCSATGGGGGRAPTSNANGRAGSGSNAPGSGSGGDINVDGGYGGGAAASASSSNYNTYAGGGGGCGSIPAPFNHGADWSTSGTSNSGTFTYGLFRGNVKSAVHPGMLSTASYMPPYHFEPTVASPSYYGNNAATGAGCGGSGVSGNSAATGAAGADGVVIVSY